jgi:nucleoid-associated protein YgaU
MSTAAVAQALETDTPATRRPTTPGAPELTPPAEPQVTGLRRQPAEPAGSLVTSHEAPSPARRTLAEPVGSDVTSRQATSPNPTRRPRIAGTTTERLPVRACSGEDLGRHVQPRLARTATRRGNVRHLTVAEAEPPALRLTRRGRALLTTVSVLVFGAAIAVLGLRVAGVLEPEPQFTRTIQVEVGPGQTLWSIAQDTNPTDNPASVVEQIANLNNLDNAADVTPGQTLQIPVR